MNAPRLWAALAALGLTALLPTPAAADDVKIAGDAVIFTVTDPGEPDLINARAMPEPQAAVGPAVNLTPAGVVWPGRPGFVAGHPGTGEESPVYVGVTRAVMDVAPQEYGNVGPYTFAIPYTTSRVDAKAANVSKFYPFRAAGKLAFTDPTTGSNYVCSASLLKPGIVVTAAHCVASFGQRRFYTNWKFYPAYKSGTAPYGVWTVSQAIVRTTYFDGTDSCSAAGVVCANDVALLVLQPQTDAAGASYYAGKKTGWLAYGYNGYGFTNNNTLITQLGYPVALDSGGIMERTDSPGMVDAGSVNNTLIGSLQTGGSSGGPWVVNLGVKPALSGISFGNASTANTVVGVTSWGFINPAYKIQGASPFTSTNIVSLMTSICSSNAAACGK